MAGPLQIAAVANAAAGRRNRTAKTGHQTSKSPSETSSECDSESVSIIPCIAVAIRHHAADSTNDCYSRRPIDTQTLTVSLPARLKQINRQTQTKQVHDSDFIVAVGARTFAG